MCSFSVFISLILFALAVFSFRCEDKDMVFAIAKHSGIGILQLKTQCSYAILV